MNTVEYLGTPCRAFAFMSGEHIPVDPWDGREKYVMGTNSASTAKGCVVFFDPDTLTAESIEVPDDTGLRAMMYLPEYERLLTGTNGWKGWLHCLDLKIRTWMEPLRIEGEEYIWNLARGGDGKIYGGSFPGCVLSCYDPATHTLVSEGRVSSNSDNLYSRMIHSLPDGNLLIYVGEQEYETHLFDVKTRQFRQVFSPGENVREVRDGVIMTGKSGGLYFYDAENFEPLDGPMPYTNAAFAKHPKVEHFLSTRLNDMYLHLLPYRQDFFMVRLNDGRAIGVLKHQVFIIKDGEITYHDVNCDPPVMMIHSMGVAPDGVVWFGSGFDNTAGYYDPKTGKYWNSPAVTQCGGEIYGVVPTTVSSISPPTPAATISCTIRSSPGISSIMSIPRLWRA